MKMVDDSLDPAGRHARQVLFAPLGAEGQARLSRGRALIVGCGALGTHAAELLARAGVGSLRLVDRDVVELSNLHRQCGFTEQDAREGIPKALALAAHLRRIDSSIEIDPRPVDFHSRSALEISLGADIILDGTDNVPTRLLLNDVSLEREIPWVYAGAVGESGQTTLFAPGSGPCLRCWIREPPPPGSLPTCDTAGVIGPAAGAIASIQAAIALRVLAGGKEAERALAGLLARLQVWSLEAAISRLERDPECPACRSPGGAREFLSGERDEEATVLCGRGAVQVRPAGSGAVDLPALGRRLRALGSHLAVEERGFFLRFRIDGKLLTVFPDGRLLAEGTVDPARALALYARYIGA